MVRNYIRKTTKGSWSEDSMRNALLERYSNNTSFRELAQKYNIPTSTLSRHATGVLKKASGTKQIDQKAKISKNNKKNENKMMTKYDKKNKSKRMKKNKEKIGNMMMEKSDKKEVSSDKLALERSGSQLADTDIGQVVFENVNMQNIDWHDWIRLVDWISIKTFGRSYIAQAAITGNSEEIEEKDSSTKEACTEEEKPNETKLLTTDQQNQDTDQPEISK
uniref:Uncharacterized LOC100177141 n=1 Tax=Ciona intestinalis TaxID=7719 RepID=F6TKK5_CIOIN|nr:uncharacterized protein LOC100177141 [Ciona intestinalis]|eukprot:XP_026689724.1 uncharacterized protein LOC100177141 [Ciona intestinalis]